MKLITLENGIEAHLLGSRAFLYFEDYSDVIYIDDIENADDPEALIIEELEKFKTNSSLPVASLM